MVLRRSTGRPEPRLPRGKAARSASGDLTKDLRYLRTVRRWVRDARRCPSEALRRRAGYSLGGIGAGAREDKSLVRRGRSRGTVPAQGTGWTAQSRSEEAARRPPKTPTAVPTTERT